MSSIQRATSPAILVVFGATGDLMTRKIIPALHHLFAQNRLSERLRVIGFSRRDWTDDQFREHVAGILRERGIGEGDERAEDFLAHFAFQGGHFEDAAAYAALAESLAAAEREWDECADKLFYLAVPPTHYAGIVEHLASSGLTVPCGGAEGWTRVLVEKPFGKDAQTAQQLDELLATRFREEQVYRIDHYLAKEMLQGIMDFRFSNNLLEPSWGSASVESIEIDLLESIGVESRGAFYDGVGALRDVGQNHLLQMLALITMEQPAAAGAAAIREAREALLARIRPLTPDEVRTETFRAQYDGYDGIAGVAPGSTTETYFKLRTSLDVPRWANVPVVMQAGKRMGSARKRIVVTFKHPHPCLCTDGFHPKNRVVFSLEPNESIEIDFWTKRPGLDREIERRAFDFFLYEKKESGQYVEEYAQLLLDAFRGDQTLFVSTDEVRSMWEFTDPIVRAWADGAVPLERYAPDTDDVVLRAALAGESPSIGIAGLGRMGANLARNLSKHGWRVVGWNRTPAVASHLAEEGVVEAAESVADLVGALTPPRTVWLMVPAGIAVDALLFGADGGEDEGGGGGGGGLIDLLEAGDTVIDGGNSLYKDAPRRAVRLAERGIAFLDVGTSGGPGGARTGACLMIGGRADAAARLNRLWTDASVTGGWRHFEGPGAGHFVKMVHNGIEYGMMQAIAEGFALMRASDYGLDLSAVADVYQHGSVVESRLVGWLDEAFQVFGTSLDSVSGSVGHTGEGAWTVEAAEELDVKAKVIETALRFRYESERNPSYTGQLLSAMRNRFGEHAV